MEPFCRGAIRFETEPTGEVRIGTTDETDRRRDRTKSARPAGFKRRAAHGVGRLDHIPDMLCAALLVDRRAF